MKLPANKRVLFVKVFTAAAHCGQSLVKSAVAPSVEDLSPLLRCRLDLTATLPHTASADWNRRGSDIMSLEVAPIVGLKPDWRVAAAIAAKYSA